MMRSYFKTKVPSFLSPAPTDLQPTVRAIAAINDALLLDTDPIVVVTHGRLLTLILKHFDSKYGFEEWQNLTTPDVFRIVIKENESQVDRIWQ